MVEENQHKHFQNTQEIKRTLFNKTKQDKTCKIFDVIIFFKLHTIQQKTVKPTYLCQLDARKLAEGKGHKTLHFTEASGETSILFFKFFLLTLLFTFYNCIVPMRFLSPGKFGLPSARKTSCYRVALPNLVCMLGILVCP